MVAKAEQSNPEKFADFVVLRAKNPETSIAELARQCGLPPGTAQKIVKRLDGIYQPVMEEVKNFSINELTKKLEFKLDMLVDAVTQDKIDNATLRDVGVLFGIFAEKRQLFRGEPTQILSYEERDNLNTLGQRILKELDRRGMTIDVTYEEVQNVNVVPPDKVQVEAVSKTAAEHAKRKNRAKNR